MHEASDFHTLKGYELQENKQITYAMEDYLEMVCRLSKEHEYVRVGELADQLNVSTSSVSKMMKNLKLSGLVEFEKYGYIRLTLEGQERGRYLIHRHNVLETFLRLVNHSEDEIEQVEKIEHFLNEQTVYNIDQLNQKLKKSSG